MSADPHSTPVPESAWIADAAARSRGRVEMFNSTRPGGLDGWTMDLTQYELVRDHIVEVLSENAGDGGFLLKDLVAAIQDRLGDHPAFPNGRLRNYCTYTKVDLEARGVVERVATGPQRVRLVSPP